MNLKTRFLLLIIGTFFIPNILIMIIFWLSFGSVENMKNTHDQFKQYYQLYEYTNSEVDRENFSDFINELPLEMNARLLDSEDHQDYTIFTDLIEKNRNIGEKKVALEAVTISFKDGSSAVLVINKMNFDKYSTFRNTPLPFIFPFLLFSVITILSLFLIRSINGSLRKIEEATRKVAEGDFEFELKAKGTDSIASLTRSFDIMRLKVKDEYDRRARFFMGVSHDLKTPLASISGYADAILEGYAEDKTTLNKYMEIIRSKTDLLSMRISHLIHFVKLETREWQATFEFVPLHEFLSNLVDSFKIEADLYKYSFEYNLEVSKELRVNMDIELVTRSFENLMHNAYRYSYPESLISFSAQRAGQEVVICIVNMGEGIDKEEFPNIFEPFYRGSKRRNEDGFGLGLANVAAVIKSHGWKIYADSELKKETVFTIKIPIESS